MWLYAQQEPQIPPLPESPQEQEVGIEGVYQCNGINSEGNVYEGVVVIQKHGDIYYVRAQYKGGGDSFGIGILENDIFSVNFASKCQGCFYSINVFVADF